MNILLVEHNERELARCAIALRPSKVEISFATYAEGALATLRQGHVTHVMTSLFFPIEGIEQPCGLAVALRAEMMGVPFAFCIDGYSHDPKHSWVHYICKMRRWNDMIEHPLAHTFVNRGVVMEKNWTDALESLTGINVPLAA